MVIPKTIKELDAIQRLICLKEEVEYGVSFNELLEHFPEYENGRVNLLVKLQFLVDEKMIEAVSNREDGKPTFYYFKTVKGMIFSLNGGYEAEAIRNDTEFKTKAFTYKYRTIPMGISILSFIISIITLLIKFL